ncbi:STAS domain-containing protein [Streptomyces sp. NPDC051909]|uniref:STAS domain-containing protein n=1 Tax=Streptomyces sp. NPDC051909 TaxID=3154944 RepID=UPI0034375F41
MDRAEDFTGRLDVRVLSGRRPDTVVLALSGELDHDTAGPLRDALAEHGGDAGSSRNGGRVVVDCSELSFCDSTGLNVLLRARLRMTEAGGRLDIAGLRPPVDRMFEITGALSVFRVYETVASALADAPAPEGS